MWTRTQLMEDWHWRQALADFLTDDTDIFEIRYRA